MIISVDDGAIGNNQDDFYENLICSDVWKKRAYVSLNWYYVCEREKLLVLRYTLYNIIRNLLLFKVCVYAFHTNKKESSLV